MFLAEIRNSAAKTKTVAESYNAGAGDTIIVDSASLIKTDPVANFLPGFSIVFPTAPEDGDVIRVIVKGYGHSSNAVSVRASHPIDWRVSTTTAVPDATFVNQPYGDIKTIILDETNLETIFVYDGTNDRWDTNIPEANLDWRRLRPTETEMAALNAALVTVDFQPSMWTNPFDYDAAIDDQVVLGWSGPTAAANHLGFVQDRFGPANLYGDDVTWPEVGPYILGDAQWHDHQYDQSRPLPTVTYALQTSATDFGWYMGTNGDGAADTAPLNVAVTNGTSIGNFVLGYRAWNSQTGEAALSPVNTSISYNTQDVFPDPAANEGYAATLMENFTGNFATVRTEIAANRPFFVCWRHWNITEKTTPANKLPPETVGGSSLTKSLPIKFYDWGAAQTTGPNSEQYYIGGADDFEDSVGHWTLCVGYIETGAGWGTTAEYTAHPHMSPNSIYLIVVDDNAITDNNGASGLAGMDQRVLKAIPVVENGVTTNRSNLLATVLVNIDAATYAQ